MAGHYSTCGITLGFVSAFVAASPAHGQSFDSQTSMMQQCKGALVMDKIAKSGSALTQMAVSSVFGSSQDKQTNASAGGSAGVYSGNLSYGSKDSSAMNSMSSSEFKKEEMSSLLSSKLSIPGADSFNQCISDIFGKPGLHVATSDADADQITLKVKYIPQTGTASSGLHLKIISNAQLVPGQELGIQSGGYDSDLIFNILNPGRSARILIAVMSKTGQVTAVSTVLRPISAIKDFDERKSLAKTDYSAVQCGGGKHTETTTGPTVTLEADGGYTIDPTSVSVVRGSLADRHVAAPDPWGTPVFLPPDAPRSVAINAICLVPDGNNFFYSSVALKGDEVRHGTYIQIPDDNGRAVPMTVYQ